MTDDLKKMVDQAVDLGKVREQLDGVAEQAAADRAIAEQRQREYDRTRAWHRAMRRAFKGIYSDRLRLQNLARYQREHGDEA